MNHVILSYIYVDPLNLNSKSPLKIPLYLILFASLIEVLLHLLIIFNFQTNLVIVKH